MAVVAMIPTAAAAATAANFLSISIPPVAGEPLLSSKTAGQPVSCIADIWPKDAAGEAKMIPRVKRSPDLGNGATGQHFGNTVAGCAGGFGGQVLHRKKTLHHAFSVPPRPRP